MKESIKFQNMYPYKYSYIDKSGRVIIDATGYQRVQNFSDGLAAVYLTNKGWGFIDKTGRLVIEPQFQEAQSFSEGMAGVEIGGRWGFIDKAGRVVIEPQYESVNSFSEGIAVVVRCEPDDASLRPANDHTIQAESIRQEVATLADLSTADRNANKLRRRGSKEVSFIDQTGRVILSRSMNEIQFNISEGARFSNGLIEAYDCAKSRYGFIDKNGHFVIEPKYVQAAPFFEELARVAVDEDGEEKLGFINRSGKLVIPPKFNTDADFRRNSTDFSEGLASLTEGLQPTVTQEASFAYINKSGVIALFTDFFYAGPFCDGMAVVYDEEKAKWGFIDRSGKVIIPLQYDFASDFSEGLASVGVLNTVVMS